MRSPESLSQAQTPEQVIVDMRKYCSACWRNAKLPPDSWEDATQQVFVRMLERVPKESWVEWSDHDSDAHKEFVRAIDTVKKRIQRVRDIRSDDAYRRHLIRSGDIAARREEMCDDFEAVGVMLQALSPRMQEVMRLFLTGMKAGEVSATLGLPVERVSDIRYKAIHALQEIVMSQA